MEQSEKTGFTTLEFQKIMLLLAEKRTAHTTLRSGVAVCAFTLTIISFLIALSAHSKDKINVILLTFVLVGATLLFLGGGYLLIRGFMRMRFHNKLILKMLQANKELATLFYHKQ
nr:hypothetical protein [Pseudodesulfovibrio sp.]